MKRRYAVFAVTFVVSLLIGIQAVEVADANPVPWPSTPNQDKPTITVETPQNNTVFAYNATDVWLNFTIANPDSWTIQHLPPFPKVHVESLEVQLDGNSVYLGRYQEKCSIKLNLNQSAPGLHTLNVTVFLNSYYRGAAYNGSHVVADDIMSSSGPVYQYPWAASEIVYFTVEQPTPTQTANASGSNYLLNQTNLILIGTAIVIVAVASISLVYFKRRRGKV